MSVPSVNAALSSLTPLTIQRVTPARQPARNPGNELARGAESASKPAAIVDEVDFSAEALQQLGEVSPEQQEVVQKLVARDREVRQHELAHLAAAGPYARGGPTYTYQKGPDGKNYAIGGEVQIDASPVQGDPEATVRKAQVVRAAALAPAEPSSQDRAVAAAATKMEQQALADIRSQSNNKTSSEASTSSEPEESFSLDILV